MSLSDFPIFGRTNQRLPSIWFAPQLPHPPREERDVERLLEVILATGHPMDLSNSPSFWGGLARGQGNFVAIRGGVEIAHARDEVSAGDVIRAHLIGTLSALGREAIDLYFLQVRRPLEEWQINGALEALETARQDGLVRNLGLAVEGSPLAALGLWQFHDAFEALTYAYNPRQTQARETLNELAQTRRVGTVTYGTLNWSDGIPFTAFPGPWRLRNLSQGFFGIPVAQVAIAHYAQQNPITLGVRSVQEVNGALEAVSLTLPDGASTFLSEFKACYDDIEEWQALSEDPRPWLAQVARRKLQHGN